MAVFVATDYNIKINGVDYSTNLTQAELSLEADDVEVTAFGSTYRNTLGAMPVATARFAMNQCSDLSPNATKLLGRWCP